MSESRAPRTARRLEFKKVARDRDYVDARYEVVIDGENMGEVTRNVEHQGSSSGGRTYYTRTWTAVVWSFEAPGYRDTINHKTRLDAVIDFLVYGKRMGYNEARRIAGKPHA